MKTQKKKLTIKQLNALGGKTTVKKMGKKYMSKIGKLGAQARWGKKLKVNKK